MADPYPLCSLENRVIPPKIPPPPSSPTQATNNDRSLTGTNFALGSYQKFQPGFRDEKRPKILGTSVSVKNSSSFYPSNRDEVFIWQIFPAHLPISLLQKPRSREPSQSALPYEHIEKDFWIRRNLEKRASQVNRAHVNRP